MSHLSYTRFNRFQLWFAKRSLFIKALFTSGIFTLLTGAIYLGVFVVTEPDHRFEIAMIFLTTVFIGGLLFAAGFAALYKHQATMLGRQLNVPDLLPVEMVELSIWFRRGITPSSQRILPVRGRYLDYLQPFVEGKKLYASKGVSNLLIILFSFNFIITVVNLVTIESGRAFRIVTALLYLFVVALNVSYRLKGGSPFAKLFNKRSTKLLADRRSEIVRD